MDGDAFAPRCRVASIGMACFAFLCVLMAWWPRVGTESVRRTEYQALVPNGQGPAADRSAYEVGWLEITYPSTGAFTAADVTISPLAQGVGNTTLGRWRNASLMPVGAMLTGRLHGEDLYVFVNNGRAVIARGCCADTIRVFPKTGEFHEIPIQDLVSNAMSSVSGESFTGVSHSFDVVDVDGEPHILCPVLYNDDRLGGASTDAIVFISARTGAIRRTVDGELFFSLFRRIGALPGIYNGAFHVEYKAQGPGPFQQWHVNAVHHFVTVDGTRIMALTERMSVEVLLLKDPYTYSAADGGGMILQRFGNPPIFDKNNQMVGRHNFGLRAADALPLTPGIPALNINANGGLHNVYYHRYKTGRETMTAFANQMHGRNQSAVIEFDVKLIHERPDHPGDHVFDTNYMITPLNFSSMAQGGARPLGDGVYIVASGLAAAGYAVVDSRGGRKDYRYSKFLYDPFVFVRVGDFADHATRLSSARSPMWFMAVLLALGTIASLAVGRGVLPVVARWHRSRLTPKDEAYIRLA